MNPFSFPAIVLASQSPRRAELLRQIGVPFDIVLPLDAQRAEAVEAELPNEAPLTYVERVSLAKAAMMRQQVQEHHRIFSNRPILCADTTVAFREQILSKPRDAQHAQQILRMLSGQTHQVHTAVAIAVGDATLQTVVTSEVRFRYLSDAEISHYIACGEPFGKAGAYAIQGFGACFVAHLTGSFSAVKGLPVFEVAQLLQRAAQTMGQLHA